ncbi:IclR family transcriptional regulator [Nocardioides marmoriginsengisoli]|uniref:IclR family transcriptional regulator n=1 Tax=Nocardioides marmoriginsengisoli TaxID=661483 RepID=UPI00161661A8|nr:IclR family transcriptional regulator [Nocardioides marmoriginsengisoli]
MDAANAGPPQAAGAGSIKSAERVLDLLQLIASEGSQAWTFSDLRARLDLPKSSLHGLLRVLTDRGYLDLDPDDKSYRIGVSAWQVGRSFLFAEQLATVARIHLRQARVDLNETFQVSILDGVDNVYITKEESDQPLRLVSEVGSRLPAYTTGLGKVLLAGLTVEEVEDRFRGREFVTFTPSTVASYDALKSQLDEVRAQGFAEDHGEFTEGVYCVAVPIRNAAGATVAAVSCSIPSARLQDAHATRERALAVLRTCADAISEAL